MKRFVPITLIVVSSGFFALSTAQPPQGNRNGGTGGPGPFGFAAPAIIQAMDANGDRSISKDELANVAAAIRKLDRDGDGQLSSQEMDWPPAIFGGNSGGKEFPFPPPPPLSAIDKNNDNTLSAEEIAGASAALKTLDRNNDGSLTADEMMPNFGNAGRQRGGRNGGGRGGFRGPGGPGGPGFGSPGGNTSGRQLKPEELEFKDGVAAISDLETYHRLSYRGDQVMIDTFLRDLEFVKFTIDGADTDTPQLYFINTETHRAHMMFGRAAGLQDMRGGTSQMKGVLVYRPMLKSPSGGAGLFTYEFEPFDQYSHEMVKKAHDILVAKMPLLKGNIGYYPRERGIYAYERDQKLYEESGPPVYLEKDLTDTDIAFLPLNNAVSFGYLRVMQHDDRPGPRDVVIYRSLPNELSRVAGVITEVRQTPLSHVNLRAVQDRIPNAFIAGATGNNLVAALIDKPVRYEVTADGFSLREAELTELDDYFEDLRPADEQVPPRDLEVHNIRPLDAIGFEDSASVGVKAANLAAMRKFKFPQGTVPNGFAVPFYFYDEFMKHNGFYDYVEELLKNPEFRQSRETQEARLKELRTLIKKGKMPEWMMASLDELHQSFPAGQTIRCRSSTNNEDLPGFSGAGLYDSCSHKKDEGHLSKSIKQVFAGMWNFRAFEEREFYRVNHLAAAMGVLVHPNFKGERANGVAVTDDILYQTDANYYVNTQMGEDLVTNPEAESIPEELLLGWYPEDGHQVMQTSSHVSDGKRLLSETHLNELRHHLGQIHGRFAKLYGKSMDDPRFAMEIEFKITKDNDLVIKQARPWVYAGTQAD